MAARRSEGSFSALPTAWNNPWQLGCLALALSFGLAAGAMVFAMSAIGVAGVVVLFIIVFSLWIWLAPKQMQRRKWEETGHCPNCGYDHRESYTICPECGGPICEDLARQRRIRAHLGEKRAVSSSAADQKPQVATETPPDTTPTT